MDMLKGLLKRGITILFLILIFLPFISAAVTTELNVSKIPPVFIGPIPNQTWQINGSLTNAFNLDDYFQETSGLALTYTYSPVSNITVMVDSFNWVSFYPDPSFIGTRNMTFNADSDGLNTTSNVVFLFVGTDSEAPKWSSPLRSKTNVYQNNYINLTTSWTDNVGLDDYFFSINQGSGWFDYPVVNFSGTQNISSQRVQISAPGGSVVYWKFCAYDLSDNFNCTSNQTINISSLPTPPEVPGGGGTGEDGSGEGSAGQEDTISSAPPAQNKKTYDFSIEPLFFKISLKQGATDTRILKVTNIGNSNLSINLSVIGLENFILLNRNNLDLLFAETEKLTIDFTSKKDTLPEEYFGKIILKSNIGNKEIPVILDVTPYDVDLNIQVNISDAYKFVSPGRIIGANININNLKEVSPDDFTLYIAIKDLYGNIYDSSQEQIRLNGVYLSEKNLTVPLNALEGEYIFYARVSNDKIVNIDSDLFEVGQRFKLQAFLKSSFIFLFIVILSLVSLILVFKYRKEKAREKILNLYLMLNELKELIKQEKIDEAIEIYIRLKNYYGEPVSKTSLDKDKLKAEIKELSKKLNSQIEESGEKVADISKEVKVSKSEQQGELEKTDTKKDEK